MTEESQDKTALTIQLRELQDLLLLPAWAQLVGEIQAQANALQDQVVFAPVTCEGDVYVAERKKGQLIGLLQLTATAQTRLENLQHSLAHLED